MAFQGPPHPRRQTDVLHRSHQTAPLNGGALSAARSDAPLRGSELADAIAEVEPILSALQPRMKAVERALAACPPYERSLDEVFAGVSAGERNFTLKMTQVLVSRQDVARKARIALQQYRLAVQNFQEAREVHAQFLAAGLAIGRVEGFSLSKFRGAIHPLYNFFLAFHGVPHFEPLFPPLDGAAATKPLTPAAAIASPQAQQAETTPLARLSRLLKDRPQLAPVEPVLQQGIEWLQKAQSAAPGLLAQAKARLDAVKSRTPRAEEPPTPPGTAEVEEDLVEDLVDPPGESG